MGGRGRWEPSPYLYFRTPKNKSSPKWGNFKKFFLIFLQNPLDITPILGYNEHVIKRGTPHREEIKMKKNTMTAISKRIRSGETRFSLGAYWYEADVNGIIRRREQQPGCTPTSDWERVARWNPLTGEITED